MRNRRRVIAILEDNADRQHEMKTCAAQAVNCNPIFFENANEMIRWLRDHAGEVCLLSLDHDLPVCRDSENRLIDMGDGLEVVHSLASQRPAYPIIIHTSNGAAGDAMVRVLRQYGWSTTRVWPHDCHAWIKLDWVAQVRALLGAHNLRPARRAS